MTTDAPQRGRPGTTQYRLRREDGALTAWWTSDLFAIEQARLDNEKSTILVCDVDGNPTGYTLVLIPDDGEPVNLVIPDEWKTPPLRLQDDTP